VAQPAGVETDQAALGACVPEGDQEDLVAGGRRELYDAPERETRGREARPGRAGPESENAG